MSAGSREPGVGSREPAGSAVEFSRVAKRYGAVPALAGVSFTVERGEMFGLIGPDGAGKTTSIRALCGLVHVDEGTIRVMGVDPIAQHRAITAKVGYLSQRFSLYGDLSVDENIAFFASLHGVRDDGRRRERLLDMTRLAKFRSRLADQLSGGMKQKLALACTLIHQPELIVLDEPTTGVDPVSRREFWKLLSEFRAEGVTILISTPYLDEAERCSRVVLLHEGRVLACDEPARLRAGLAGTLLEVIVPTPRDAVRRLRATSGAPRVQLFGDRLHVWSEAADPEAAAAWFSSVARAAGVTPERMRPITPSLEDVFIARLSSSTTGMS